MVLFKFETEVKAGEFPSRSETILGESFLASVAEATVEWVEGRLESKLAIEEFGRCAFS